MRLPWSFRLARLRGGVRLGTLDGMINLDVITKALPNNPAVLRECWAHFSQFGEDIMVQTLLRQERTPGFFMDIGAYHPFQYSNTFLLYLAGWRGVNVDASETAIELFQKVRSLDINVRALVSDRLEAMRYYKFREGAFNTTSEASAKDLLARNPPSTQLLGEETLIARPINELLTEYATGKRFDFLNIDVEGMDQKLLYGIDFERFRPKVIALEIEIDAWSSEQMKSFLKKQGYQVFAQCAPTVILSRER